MKFLAASLLFFGISAGLCAHAGVIVVTTGTGFRLVKTGETARTLTSEDLAKIATDVPGQPLAGFYETLRTLRNEQVFDLLGMNRELADRVVESLRERISHHDAANLETLAQTVYLAADLETFQNRNHPNLYFKNYLGAKDLPALVLKQLGTAFEVSADDALSTLRSPEALRDLARETTLLEPDQLRLPASVNALRDVFEFAAAKDIFASYRTYRSFVYLYVADDSARQIFKTNSKGSTLETFEIANHARFLSLVGDFHLEFAVARLKEVSGASAFEYAEEVLRSHRLEGMSIDSATFEQYLQLVRGLTVKTRSINSDAATSRDDVIKNLALLTSLQKVAVSQLDEFKSRHPNQYWRDLYRDAFDIGLVQYTFGGGSAATTRSYSIESIVRLNEAKLRACQLLFSI